MFRIAIAVCVCALAASVAASALGQMPILAEHPAIAYSSSTPTDAIARLQQKIDAGEVTLAFEPDRGYLKSVLDALAIPASSQGLVGETKADFAEEVRRVASVQVRR
jgi:Flp pilus assembly protein TadD